MATISRVFGVSALIYTTAACGVIGPGSGLESEDASGAGQPAGSGGAGAGGSTASGNNNGGATTGGGLGGAGAGLPTPMVDWQPWATQQSRSNDAWGSALTDIANHLPSQYGTTYDDFDLVTFAHETSHGIHAHLRNYENNSGKDANAFYVLNDQAAIVQEPNMWKDEMVPYVPNSLRDFRYSTYITGATAWNDTPLYIWDEWNAYVNGAEIGVNRVIEGKWNDGWRDQSGNLEFVVYAMCLAHAVSEIDPSYWQGYPQFREFLMWNTERAMALFQQHQSMPEFQSDSVAAYYETFKTSADAEELRSFIRTTFGDAWSAQVLGF